MNEITPEEQALIADLKDAAPPLAQEPNWEAQGHAIARVAFDSSKRRRKIGGLAFSLGAVAVLLFTFWSQDLFFPSDSPSQMGTESSVALVKDEEQEPVLEPEEFTEIVESLSLAIVDETTTDGLLEELTDEELHALEETLDQLEPT